MGSWKLLDGNHAAAWGARLSNAQVVGIYPITPQTEVVSQISQFVADGEMKAELVVAECEHSALSICIGASAMGSRAFTASCSQGIVHMEEPIWFVPGYRLPIVMGVVNRPIAFPAGESKHGPISLVEPGFPVIFVCPMDSTHKTIIGNIMEMKARGASIIAILEEEDEEIKRLADDYIEVPKGIPEVLSPTLFVIPLQLLAYYLAVEKGLDPDKPRNLAKSVTVK